MSSRLPFTVGLSVLLAACGGGLPPPPAGPPPAVPAPPPPAPVAARAPAAQPRIEPEREASATPPPPSDEEEPPAATEHAKTPPPPPPAPVEASGKLLTKPSKGTLQVEIASSPPSVGDEADLSRVIDRSVPIFGGGWIVIAKTEVVKVDGKRVTLKVVEERAQMKINGKKLDHFTPGVAIRLRSTKK
ncbi:MAG: hypothetical protein JST00_40695 [Deltaproteobacteria bacterium]|nr:hypothetical protein [Deltaproteobacteria bacterium]